MGRFQQARSSFIPVWVTAKRCRGRRLACGSITAIAVGVEGCGGEALAQCVAGSGLFGDQGRQDVFKAAGRRMGSCDAYRNRTLHTIVQGRRSQGPGCRNLVLQIEGRLEPRVDGNLVTGDQFVGGIGHPNDLLQLLEHFRCHAFAEGRSGVRGDAI